MITVTLTDDEAEALECLAWDSEEGSAGWRAFVKLHDILDMQDVYTAEDLLSAWRRQRHASSEASP